MSEMKPRALKMMTTGMSFLMYGMVDRIWWPSMALREGAPYICKNMVDVGLAPVDT